MQLHKSKYYFDPSQHTQVHWVSQCNSSGRTSRSLISVVIDFPLSRCVSFALLRLVNILHHSRAFPANIWLCKLSHRTAQLPCLIWHQFFSGYCARSLISTIIDFPLSRSLQFVLLRLVINLHHSRALPDNNWRHKLHFRTTGFIGQQTSSGFIITWRSLGTIVLSLSHNVSFNLLTFGNNDC